MIHTEFWQHSIKSNSHPAFGCFPYIERNTQQRWPYQHLTDTSDRSPVKTTVHILQKQYLALNLPGHLACSMTHDADHFLDSKYASLRRLQKSKHYFGLVYALICSPIISVLFPTLESHVTNYQLILAQIKTH